MPLKKKARWKERKAKTLAIKEKRESPAAQQLIRQLKRDGCRITFKNDGSGSSTVRHPCMNGMNDLNMSSADMRKFSDRSFLNDGEKQEFVSILILLSFLVDCLLGRNV